MRCGTECMDVGMDCISPVCADYEKRGLFLSLEKVESVHFEFGKYRYTPPAGTERLKLATVMD